MIFHVMTVGRSLTSRKYGYISKPRQIEAVRNTPHGTIINNPFPSIFEISVPDNVDMIREVEQYYKKHIVEYYKQRPQNK